MSHDKTADSDLIHRIVVEDDRMTNPYAELSTLVDKLSTLKSYLIDVARHEAGTDGYSTYMQTKDAVGIFTARQSRVLGTLGLHEDELGNPLLPALVVQTGADKMVGEKYFTMVRATRNHTDTIPESVAERKALWRDHVRAVRKHWQE